jgi:MFS family permease
MAISKTGKYRWANWLGWCFTVIGMSLLVLLKDNTSTIVWIVISIVGGIGMGTLYPAMMLGVQASSSSSVEDQAYATNIFTFLRALGQTFGVTIGGIVFQSMMERKMLSKPLLFEKAKEYSKDAVGLVQIIKAMPDNELKAELKESFVFALMYIWVVVAVLSGVALIASLFIKGYDISSPSEVNQNAEENKS